MRLRPCRTPASTASAARPARPRALVRRHGLRRAVNSEADAELAIGGGRLVGGAVHALAVDQAVAHGEHPDVADILESAARDTAPHSADEDHRMLVDDHGLGRLDRVPRVLRGALELCDERVDAERLRAARHRHYAGIRVIERAEGVPVSRPRAVDVGELGGDLGGVHRYPPVSGKPLPASCAQTTLTSPLRTMPHALASASTSSRPRPEVAIGDDSCILGSSALQSRTSMRTPSSETTTETVKSERACSMALVASSVTTRAASVANSSHPNS